MVPAVDVKNSDVGRQVSLAIGLDLPAEDGHTGVRRSNWKGRWVGATEDGRKVDLKRL